jgi:hypothetical protein
MWVAVGHSLNSIAYSSNGINWTGLGTSLFTIVKNLSWSGTKIIAAGDGNNHLAYSFDGINWTGLGNSIFQEEAMGTAFFK